MEVEYTTTNYRDDKDKQETQRIAEFLYNEILYKEGRGLFRDKVHLEEQPKVVCEAMGRMISVLLDKGVLNLEDLKFIADCRWGRTSDSLKLKKEEE